MTLETSRSSARFSCAQTRYNTQTSQFFRWFSTRNRSIAATFFRKTGKKSPRRKRFAISFWPTKAVPSLQPVFRAARGNRRSFFSNLLPKDNSVPSCSTVSGRAKYLVCAGSDRREEVRQNGFLTGFRRVRLSFRRVQEW